MPLPERELEHEYDVVIVGARCAGASTAMLLARRGARVLVVEKGRYGTDTLSTLAIMRGGVLQLGRWGVLPRIVERGTPAVRTTSFFYGGEEIALPIKARDGIDALYAPRRTVLDAALVDRATDAGAEVAYETRLVDLVRDKGRVTGAVVAGPNGDIATVRANVVIGADGRSSAVARLVQAEPYRVASSTSSIVYGHWAGVPAAGFEWHFEPGVSTGLMPTNDGLSLVFASMPPAEFPAGRAEIMTTYHRVLAEAAPKLASRVRRGDLVGSFRGFAGLPGYFRQSHGPGWALVGDAGYFKDPLTAHGITDALRDAELLAEACADGTNAGFARYQATRDELSVRLFEITDRIASLEWDLDEAKELHVEMSREMNREVAAMARPDVAA